MLSRMLGAALFGIEATIVRVEVHGSSGLPAVSTVGLPDSAVRESRERVRSAILNSGFTYPQRRITVNLAPADVRKAGSLLDLPVAAAIVALNEGALAEPIREDTLLMGELSLDGSVRAVPGALSAALAARGAGLKRLIVAAANVEEAEAIEGLDVVGVSTLAETIGVLNGAVRSGDGRPARAERRNSLLSTGEAMRVDLREVRGQAAARRALEVAAAGGHNVLLVGPPGAGKTMLAHRFPTLLPPLTIGESLEITQIHSAAGRHGAGGLVRLRPFRSPHHTASAASLAGGGGHWGVRPGEASLAHHGVLFLDELPEFNRPALEALRQPLEDGFLTISRVSRTFRLPASFMLVAAMNPCKCGFLGSRTRECLCTPPQIAQYRNRVSGPLLDRIDLHVEVPAVAYKEMIDEEPAESSAAVRARVVEARARQRERCPTACNARMSAALLREHCVLDRTGRGLMERAMTKLGLSARGHDRILKVARTIADLAGAERIEREHLAEAIQYR